MGIAGSFDNNLKELEKISGSKIYFRGNSIAIKGKKNANEKVKDAIEYLIYRFRSDKKIDKNDIVAALNKDITRAQLAQIQQGRRTIRLDQVGSTSPRLVGRFTQNIT